MRDRTICSAKRRLRDEAYYGVQSARAMESFILGVLLSEYPDLNRALAMVKLAAARAN